VLSRDIPAFIVNDFAPFCDAFMMEQGLSRQDLGEPACHPGGGRVVDALDDYFGPEVGGIAATRKILKLHGNMSSPTLLFVLKEILTNNESSAQAKASIEGSDKPIMMTALGPGFTAVVGILDPKGGYVR